MDNDNSNVTVEGNVPLYSHETAEYVKASTAPVCLEYKISPKKSLENAVCTGKVYTSSDVDYTVKVEAKHLKPYTQYCKYFEYL